MIKIMFIALRLRVHNQSCNTNVEWNYRSDDGKECHPERHTLCFLLKYNYKYKVRQIEIVCFVKSRNCLDERSSTKSVWMPNSYLICIRQRTFSFMFSEMCTGYIKLNT